MSYSNAQYSDLLRAVNQYGSVYNYGDPQFVNPYSGAAYSPASYREIMSRKPAPVDPRSAYTDYKPGFAGSLATGALGYQMGSQGLEPMAKGIYSGLTQSEWSGQGGNLGGLTLGSTIYGATRDMNPYDYSSAEQIGNYLGPASMGWSLGGMVSSGAAAGPIGAIAGLIAGMFMDEAQRKKTEKANIEAEETFQEERTEYTEDVAKEFEEQREQYALGAEADLWGQEASKYSNQYGAYANPYGQSYYDKGGKLTSKEKSKLKKLGRRGDTELAHVNPQEKAMLKAMGGSGTINPYTRLREYNIFDDIWDGIKDWGQQAYDALIPSGRPGLSGIETFYALLNATSTPEDQMTGGYWETAAGQIETAGQSGEIYLPEMKLGPHSLPEERFADINEPEYQSAQPRFARSSRQITPKNKVKVVDPFGQRLGQASDKSGDSTLGLEGYRWDLANPYIRENVDVFDKGGKLTSKKKSKLKKLGRKGDTELAHVNPQEKAMLEAMGGSGTTNPYTGLPEYHYKGWNPFNAHNTGHLNKGIESLFNPTMEGGVLRDINEWSTSTSPSDYKWADSENWMEMGAEAGLLGSPEPEPSNYLQANPRLARDPRKRRPEDRVNVVDPFGGGIGQMSDTGSPSTFQFENYRWDLANPYIRENVDIFDEGGVVTQPESLPVDSMFNRQLFAESSFNPSAESPAGALGLSQITEPTFNDMIGWGWVPEGKEFSDLKTDTDLAVNLQERYMNDLMTREWNTGSEDVVKAKALAAYNMGPTALVRVLNKEKEKGTDIYNSLDWVNNLSNYKKGYKETTNYVNKIMLGGSEKYEQEYTDAWKAGGKDYDQGGITNTVAEFTGNEMIVNNQSVVEAGIKENNPSKAAAPIRLAMQKGFVTPGQEAHGGNPMPVDDKGFIYTKGGKLPFRVRKNAGIYDHATDQFKQDMTDEQIMAVAKKNIAKWEKNNMN